MDTSVDLLRQSYGNVVGIDAEGNVYGGYDESFYGASAVIPEWWEGESFPPAEKVKLADVMIGRWMSYKAAAETTLQTTEKKNERRTKRAS